MPTTQIPLFYVPPKRPAHSGVAIATTPEVDALLQRDPVCALNISGGKDGAAAALIAMRHLDAIGHAGPRLCIHADLGRVEWSASQDMCQELADHLGLELVTVRRKAGGLMERWLQRWTSNVERYRNLACATLILPWSTAKWRFCTGELKSSIIAAQLKRRFPGSPIVNITGIRRQESRARAAKSILSNDEHLVRKGVEGYLWHPAIEYLIDDIWATLHGAGLRIHPAYAVYQSTRVSCKYCILASQHDLLAATRCAENHAVYVEMVELEAVSSFSFQSGKWLADIAPALLSDDLRARIALAKQVAAERMRLEATIPAHLMFTDSLPTQLPTPAEAQLLAAVRREVGQMLGLQMRYTTGDAVQARYAQLLQGGKKALKVVLEDQSDRAPLILPASAGGTRTAAPAGQMALEL